MTRKNSKPRFSVGQLVDAAYAEAGRITSNRQVAALIASRLLEELLSASDRPDLVRQLQGTGS